MGAERDTFETSEDAVLGGRLRLRQPLRGHRVGHDAILLAAATGGARRRAGGRSRRRRRRRGSGAGRARRGLNVTLVEIDPALCALAADNARLNRLDDRVRALVADAEDAQALAAAGLSARQHRPGVDEPAVQRRDAPERLARSAPPAGACRRARPAAALGRNRGVAAQAARRADADLAGRWAGRRC